MENLISIAGLVVGALGVFFSFSRIAKISLKSRSISIRVAGDFEDTELKISDIHNVTRSEIGAIRTKTEEINSEDAAVGRNE